MFIGRASAQEIDFGSERHNLIYKIAPAYGVDPELAIAITYCEGSSYKRVGNNKNIKDGQHWSTDVGWWQINDYYHEARAMGMGLDIRNDKDNIIYGLFLLGTEGVNHWKASKNCWNPLV